MTIPLKSSSLKMNNNKELALKQALMQLSRNKQYPEAKKKALKLVKLNPKDLEVWFALAQLQAGLGEVSDAVSSFCHASKAPSPFRIEALKKAVNLCLKYNLHQLGITPAKKLISLSPELALAYFAHGYFLYHVGRFINAIDSLKQALAREPNHPEYLHYLGFSYTNTAQPDEAIAIFNRCQRIPNSKQESIHLNLIAHNYSDTVSEQTVFKAHRDYGKQLEQKYPIIKAFPISDHVKKRIRIGYVSQDFRSHAVSHFIRPLLENYSKDKFDIYCYSDVETPDKTTQRIKDSIEHWCDCSQMSDHQLYQQIQSDKIDILVDLVGYLGKVRMEVFAQKAAPVQVSYLGYPNTTGLDAMDFRITDELADPEGQVEKWHTENLQRLPGGFLCYAPDSQAPVVTELPAKKRNGQICFGSCNNFPKITPRQIELWARILQAVPNSRFYMKAFQLVEEALQERVFEIFEQHGIGKDRVELKGWTDDQLSRLSCYDHIDIHLDSYPYNGTTTTFEALWQGVPTVTRFGEAHRSRVGLSILSRVGLADFIAKDEQQYVELAIQKANDLEALGQLRAELRERLASSDVMNRTRFISELEACYLQMWEECLQS